jgi:hypothetical protein
MSWGQSFSGLGGSWLSSWNGAAPQVGDPDTWGTSWLGAGGHWGFSWIGSQPETPPVEPQPPPAGRPAKHGTQGPAKRKRRLFVQIDGQDFPVDSVEHAIALLDRAKALARSVAPEKAEERLTVHLVNRPTQRPKIEKPRIASSNPELQTVIKQARAVIGQIYADAYRDAEIKLRLARLGEDHDDDDDVIMLI